MPTMTATETREALLVAARWFFCDAMSLGYAFGAKATPIPGRPNGKYYEHANNLWYLRDEYEVDPITKKSAGFTFIEYDQRRIWVMAYGGFYKQEAIPCLKAALMANYTRGDFYAGRGRDGYKHGECLYLVAAGLNEQFGFDRFFARERIFRAMEKDGVEVPELLGGHDVWGMALI